MGEELRWLVGVALSVLVAFGGMLWGAMSRMTAKMEAGDDKLHERINKVRDDYVRRDDLDKHLASIDRKLDSLARSQEQMTQSVMAALARHGGQQ